MGDDAANGKSVNKKKFHDKLTDARMIKYLKAMDLSPEQVHDSHFFELIDKDGSQYLEIEELITGCLYLTGSAKAVELASLQHEFRHFAEWQILENQHARDSLGKLLTTMGISDQ